MDSETWDSQPRRSGSFGRLSSAGSSRRRSLGLSYSLPQVDDDSDSETVSEAGDIGPRVLSRRRSSASGRVHLSFDDLEHGTGVPIQEEGTPLENKTPLPTDAIIQPGEGKKDEAEAPWIVDFTYLLCLAIFGILGVVTRFYLQRLFGPQVIGATSDGNYMYLDLPANMIGSFLMGWFGVVFKGDIVKISDQLAVGLSTGFLGSLTTFSGWNQKILELCVRGQWVFAVLAFIIGLFLTSKSIDFGIVTAKGFNLFLERSNIRSRFSCASRVHACISGKYISLFMMVLLLVLCILWGTFIGLEMKDFKTGGSEAQLYLACLVGPVGVWLRWYLACLNGRGLGKDKKLKWIPFGTLAANVLAACIMAALAILKKALNTRTCDTVANGIQLGLLGCLSTVSTFMAEFHAMEVSKRARRAYAYAGITFLISFILGTLIFSVPFWAKGYKL